jgi:hypothetical protein
MSMQLILFRGIIPVHYKGPTKRVIIRRGYSAVFWFHLLYELKITCWIGVQRGASG